MSVAVSVDPNTLPKGVPFAVFVPGVTAYQSIKSGKPVDLVGPADKTMTAKVNQKFLNPLVVVLNQFGPQHYINYGKMYDVSTLVDMLADEFPDEDPADCRTLYTVLMVQLEMVATI